MLVSVNLNSKVPNSNSTIALHNNFREQRNYGRRVPQIFEATLLVLQDAVVPDTYGVEFCKIS